MAPNIAAPKLLPILRKKVTAEVAVPISLRPIAFCTAEAPEEVAETTEEEPRESDAAARTRAELADLDDLDI